MWSLNGWRDAIVVRRVREGQREEFAVLVSRYLQALHAFACARVGNAADADDIAQETFVRAYEAIGTLDEPARFGPWLFAIARNFCRNHRRGESRRTAHEALVGVEHSIEPKPEENELHRVVRHKLEQLEADDRELLLLRYYAGKQAVEIARLLGISAAAARKRLQRAREALGEAVATELGLTYDSKRSRADRTRAILALTVGTPSPPRIRRLSTRTRAAVGGLAGVAGLAALVLLSVSNHSSFSSLTTSPASRVTPSIAKAPVPPRATGGSDVAVVAPVKPGSRLPTSGGESAASVKAQVMRASKPASWFYVLPEKAVVASVEELLEHPGETRRPFAFLVQYSRRDASASYTLECRDARGETLLARFPPERTAAPPAAS